MITDASTDEARSFIERHGLPAFFEAMKTPLQRIEEAISKGTSVGSLNQIILSSGLPLTEIDSLLTRIQVIQRRQ
jgi:hypothetical protein